MCIYIYTCNIQVCKKNVASWNYNYKNYCRFLEKMSFCKNKSFELCDFEWIFAPGALKLLCENTMKVDLPIMLLECLTNWVNWGRTEFVHVDMCILLKLIEVYIWKRIRPTTGFEFLCNMSFSPPWDMCRMMTDLVMPTRSGSTFLKLNLPKFFA